MGALLKVSAEIDADDMAFAREAKARIASLHQKVMTDVVEIGRTLIQVKERLGHGNFLPWLKTEFGWAERTARNFMSVAERFGAKPAIVADLPLGVVYRLAAPSTPDAVREQIVQRLEGPEPPSSTAIDWEISEARREADRQRVEAKRSFRGKPISAETRARREREHQAQVRRVEEISRQRGEAKQTVVQMIASRFDEAELERLVELIETMGWLRSEDLAAAMTPGSN